MKMYLALALVAALLAPAEALVVGARPRFAMRARTPMACAEPEPEPEPERALITLTEDEDKALREVRIELGLDGKYGSRDSRDPSTWVVVKEDYPVLASREDIDLRNALYDLKPTAAELLKYTPIGPFLAFSAIGILLYFVKPGGF